MSIETRKSEHIKICLEKDVHFRQKTNGFEKYEFIHCALPEINFDDIKTEVPYLDKTLSFPFMFSAMTGGFEGAVDINRQLAEICAEKQIGMAVGSQRTLIESDDQATSFSVVREVAPEALIFGNLGAYQLKVMQNITPVQKMADVIEADAMIIHLNPLQEVIQPEGEIQFSNILPRLEHLVKHLKCPVIVKETGCGISEDVARKLKSTGIYAIDVAGAGGTSWAGIESYRSESQALANTFWDWGIPTADSLMACNKIPGIHLIASGGLENGLDIAKAIAMGASLCGIALPALRILMEKGKEELMLEVDRWKKELQVAMFLTGSGDINALQTNHNLKSL